MLAAGDRLPPRAGGERRCMCPGRPGQAVATLGGVSASSDPRVWGASKGTPRTRWPARVPAAALTLCADPLPHAVLPAVPPPPVRPSVRPSAPGPPFPSEPAPPGASWGDAAPFPGLAWERYLKVSFLLCLEEQRRARPRGAVLCVSPVDTLGGGGGGGRQGRVCLCSLQERGARRVSVEMGVR